MENKENHTTINEALGIPTAWRDKKQDDVANYFMESDLSTLSEIMEQVALDTKEEEFGEPNSEGYELTSYEKKLVYAGFMIAQELDHMKALAAKKELMVDIIKAMLGKGGKDKPGGLDLEGLFGNSNEEE